MNDPTGDASAEVGEGIGTCRVRDGSMSRLAWVLLVSFILIVVNRPASAAGAGRDYFEIDGGYKTGDFGTPVTTDLTYFSAVLGHVTPDYDLSVTVPYLFLKNTAGGSSASESGVGDVLLHAGMILVPEGKKGFSSDGSIGVKLPTASDTKGLGTGETDYGAFLGLHQRLGEYKLTLNGGYIKVGQPANVTYNDIYLFDIGVSRAFGFTQVYAYFEQRKAPIPGAKNPQEINLSLFHVLNIDYALRASGFVGLNDGGPSSGFSLGVVRWF